MLKALIAYDSQGNVVATLDHVVAKDEDGKVIGLIDFAAHEDQNGRMRDIWDAQRLDQPIPPGILKQVLGRDPQPGETVTLPPDHPWRVAHDTVAGSCTWPEWLGGAAYDFKVELDENKRAKALIHKKSGHRRERSEIEAAISERINEKKLEAHQKGDAIRDDLRKRGMHENDIALVDDPTPEPVDLRDLLGGPNRPLLLDPETGRTRPKVKSEPSRLPVVKREQPRPSTDRG